MCPHPSVRFEPVASDYFNHKTPKKQLEMYGIPKMYVFRAKNQYYQAVNIKTVDAAKYFKK